MIDQEILDSIQNPAGVLQFAKDGKYEEAWIIDLADQNEPSTDQISEYVNDGTYEKLIVEYIWNQDEDEQRYVLTVVQDKNCQEQSKFQFVKKCADIFFDEVTFSETLKRLDHEIVGHTFLLKQPVQRVRLGIFNHWFSVGPIEMWDSGDALSLEAITKKIKSRPEIERSALNYQGLAFIYNFDGSLPGPYHVLKTPTCRKEGGEWVVDISLIYKNMQDLLEQE